MGDGWIKLHRKLLDSLLFDNPDLLKVWIWCLLKASHKEHEQIIGLQTQTLKEGQFIFGRRVAAMELKMSESKIYRLIKKIESENGISIKSNNKYSIVTIEKWGDYQSCNNDNEQQMNSKRTTNEQQMNTNKNVKNVKNNIYGEIDDKKAKEKQMEKDADILFEKLWKLYPIKKGKASVKKTGRLKLLKIGFEEMERAINRYKDYVSSKDWLHYQNGSTFFNNGYIDYLDENYTEDKDKPTWGW